MRELSDNQTSTDGALADGAVAQMTDDDEALTGSVALFETDEGRLELAQRKALLALLKQRFVTARTHPAEWRTLLAHTSLLRSRLNDLFLDLHVDREREVAFKRQAVPDGGKPFPTLLYDKAWSREETILMVYLRSCSRAEEASGTNRVFVDREEMLEHVASLRPSHATDRSADARRAVNALEALNKAGLLVGSRDDERFEISPAIDVVLPLERLQDLLRWLQGQNSGDEQAVLDEVDEAGEEAPLGASPEDATRDAAGEGEGSL